jgi:hypothetical protein
MLSGVGLETATLICCGAECDMSMVLLSVGGKDRREDKRKCTFRILKKHSLLGP